MTVHASGCPKAIAVSPADLALAEQRRPQRREGIRAYLKARAAAAKEDKASAQAALEDVVASGLIVLPGPQDPLNRYLTDPELAPSFAHLRQRLAPTANGRPAVEAGSTPITAESLAYDPVSRRFYISNWFDNAIYSLTLGGRLSRYFALPELTPNGVKIDGMRRHLWFVATNAFRDGAAEPRSKLWRIDLRTGASSSFEAAGAKGFNDLAIAANGDVYVTDTPGGALYVLRTGARELERFLPGERFQQPNGIAADDGHFLFVAQGLDLLRIDLASGTVEPVQVPPAVETLGTDGLIFRKGRLYLIENLMTAGAVIELTLDRSRTKTVAYRLLDQANPSFDLPTAGTFAGESLYVLASTQLYRFGSGRQPAAGELKPLRLLAYRRCG